MLLIHWTTDLLGSLLLYLFMGFFPPLMPSPHTRPSQAFTTLSSVSMGYASITAANKTQVPDHQLHTLLPKTGYLLPGLIYTGVLWKGVFSVRIHEGIFPANKDRLTCTCLLVYSHTPNPRVFRINSAGITNPHQGH